MDTYRICCGCGGCAGRSGYYWLCSLIYVSQIVGRDIPLKFSQLLWWARIERVSQNTQRKSGTYTSGVEEAGKVVGVETYLNTFKPSFRVSVWMESD